MSIEIEGKMRLTDPAALEDKLRDMQAAFHGESLETNTYFDTPTGDLKSRDQGLRIRIRETGEQRSVTITHKGPRAHGPLKKRNETQLTVHDAPHAGDLLTELGYQPVLTFEKRRRSWRLDDCLVELDQLPYLGDFVEIEAPTDAAVLAMRDRLALGDQPLIKTSYIAMMATYAREHQLPDHVIRFADVEIA